MSLFKCKMCGGALEINNETVATCEYCGTQQTLPKSNDEVINNLFNRANNLRLKCEFDKAAQIYEKILEQDDSEAEAHWGIVLCKYGIEYVEDPTTFKRIPTCHRTSFDAITIDADYLAAIDYSDSAQQQIYESEARAIDRIQRDILAIVKNEKPFDVFICYKETDANGKRTIDSSIANDIYHQLTQEGFKAFYAAITLEDKLGQEYEPYIFAALHSAKVMLAIGTRPEYFSAVWVKNEWSRFMQLMKTDRSKLLIPCYRDMDAYDLPEEFAHLQAQDMSKIGFINDVVRGIKKVLAKDESKPTVVKETVITSGNANVDPLLKRAFMFLEDGDWKSADDYCEKVLDIDPENAQAYLGKLMAELKINKAENLKCCEQSLEASKSYQKIIRFGEDELVHFIQECNDAERKQRAYATAKELMDSAITQGTFWEAAELLKTLGEYKDSQNLLLVCESSKKEVERCEQLIAELVCIRRSDSEIEKIKVNIGFYQQKLKQLLELKNNWDAIDQELHAIQNRIASADGLISDLIKEKESLNFLRVARKKEIDLAISGWRASLVNMRKDEVLIKNKYQGFDFLDSLLNKISSIEAKIQELTESYDAMLRGRSEADIRAELNRSVIGRKILSKFNSDEQEKW